MTKAFSFKVLAKHQQTRRGVIQTAHGEINTPAFMPVGTRGTVKAMLPESIKNTNSEVILSNTYHLMLRPGPEIIKEYGGLRKFINWYGPILTDSGGFQIMSLSKLCKVREEGVEFKSHIDGSKHFLSPEIATNIQYQLDSTITMAFDECTAYPATYERARNSMELSTRWAKRSRDKFIMRKGYGQFGIVQGSIYEDLRSQSVKDLVELDFEGYAIGGLAVGEGQDEMFLVLDYTTKL